MYCLFLLPVFITFKNEKLCSDVAIIEEKYNINFIKIKTFFYFLAKKNSNNSGKFSLLNY